MLYEVTVTLKPYWNSRPTRELVALITGGLASLGPEWPRSAVIELHDSGVPHAHCLVKIKDIFNRSTFLDRLRGVKKGYQPVFGRVSCTQVIYEDSYRAYMIKDVARTRAVIGTDPIIIDDLKVGPKSHLIEDTAVQAPPCPCDVVKDVSGMGPASVKDHRGAHEGKRRKPFLRVRGVTPRGPETPHSPYGNVGVSGI